ncbi:MAG: hypothetical protein LBI39_02340 [Puniceicoccales bacterium]|jgi:hypothetical protein|nr:hypothetical protein [Puniceicoccales bacterium]
MNALSSASGNQVGNRPANGDSNVPPNYDGSPTYQALRELTRKKALSASIGAGVASTTTPTYGNRYVPAQTWNNPYGATAAHDKK